VRQRTSRKGDEVRWSGTRPSVPLLLAASLLLAACAPVDGPADRAPDRTPVVVDETLGVVRVAPGSPVFVRIVLDGEGDPESLGPVLEAAFRTAVEDFGAVQQGFRIELGDVVTSDCSRATGEQVGRELAAATAEEGVVGVLGPQCTATLLGLQAQVAAAGMVVVTSRPQELSLTEGPDGLIAQDRVEGTWRTAPSLLREARTAAEYAIEDLGLDRAATIHDGSVESAALVDAFRRRFEALGGTVVVARRTDATLTGDDDAAAVARTALLDAIAGGQVGALFLPIGEAELIAVGDALAERPRLASITRITTSAAATPSFLAEESALGMLYTGPVLDFTDAVSAVTGMSASQTLERVSASSGTGSPAGWWAYAYDAATLLMKAIEDSSLIDVDGSFVLSRAELREALARTTIGGLTGTVRCSGLGDCAAPGIAIRSHEDPSARMLAQLPVLGVLGD